GFEPAEGRRIGLVAPFGMRDGYAQDFGKAGRERTVGDRRHEDIATLETKVLVACQRAGQKSYFGEDLKPIADPEHIPAALGVTANVGHDRAHLGDRATA